MKFSVTTPTSHVALYLVFLLDLSHAIIPFLTATFGSSAYFAHLDLIDMTAALDGKAKILELEVRKADLAIQGLQIDLQKANISANVEMQKSADEKEITLHFTTIMHEKAKLEEATKQSFFTNFHKAQVEKTRLERYKEHRMFLDKMVAPGNWASFDNQGFLKLSKDKY